MHEKNLPYSLGGWKGSGRRVGFKKILVNIKFLWKGFLDLTIVAGIRDINLPESIFLPK